MPQNLPCITAGMNVHILQALSSSSTNGKTFGYIDGAIQMPLDGACYVAEFFQKETELQYKILAYIDVYGRIFETDTTISIPPARFDKIHVSPHFFLSPVKNEWIVACAQTPEEFEENCEDLNETEIEKLKNDSVMHTDIYLNDNEDVFYSVGHVTANFGNFNYETDRFALNLINENLDYQACMASLYIEFIQIPLMRGVSITEIGCDNLLNSLIGNSFLDSINAAVMHCENPHLIKEGYITGAEKYFARLLRATDLVDRAPSDFIDPNNPLLEELELEQIIPALGIVLNYSASSNHYMIGYDFNLATAEASNALLCCEAAINRFALLVEELKRENKLYSASEEECALLSQELEKNLTNQASLYLEKRNSETEETKDAQVRYNFALACEEFKSPYRSAVRFRLNLDNHALAMELSCPPVESMCPLIYSEEEGIWRKTSLKEKNDLRLHYARQQVFIHAGNAFDASDKIEDVYINGTNFFFDGSYIYSVHISFNTYSEIAENYEIALEDKAQHLFDRSEANYRVNHEGSFCSVQPSTHIQDIKFCPVERIQEYSTLNLAIPENYQKDFGVDYVCDLYIQEYSRRMHYAETITQTLALRGTRAAVEVTKNIQEHSEDPVIHSICKRVIELMVSNSIDNTFAEIDRIFHDPYDFADRISKIIASTHENRDERVEKLTQLLEDIETMGLFADDDSNVYRYFDTIAARMLYYRDFNDGRTINPLPEAIYNIHYMLAVELSSSFTEYEQALHHAQECIRIAPTVARGYLVLSRCYFIIGDMSTEIRILGESMPYLNNLEDLALILYWLGYAFWKTNHPMEAAICYYRSAYLDQNIAVMASRELHEMFEEIGPLKQLDTEKEDDLLDAQGIALEDMKITRTYMLNLSDKAANMGSYNLAHAFMEVALSLDNDPMLLPIFESYSF